MSDSYAKYKEECEEYAILCKLLGVEKRQPDIDYKHYFEMIRLPYVKKTPCGFEILKKE